MILVDTGVWSEHFRLGVPRLSKLLKVGRVATHPWIIGELALGPGLRLDVLDDLRALPTLGVIDDSALLNFVVLHSLRGIGWVDAQLLAAALHARAQLWTNDGTLNKAAHQFNVGFPAHAS